MWPSVRHGDDFPNHTPDHTHTNEGFDEPSARFSLQKDPKLLPSETSGSVAVLPACRRGTFIRQQWLPQEGSLLCNNQESAGSSSSSGRGCSVRRDITEVCSHTARARKKKAATDSCWHLAFLPLLALLWTCSHFGLTLQEPPPTPKIPSQAQGKEQSSLCDGCWPFRGQW